jgi:hypothetical protein
MAGLIVTRFVLRLEPVVSMSADEIVRLFGPPLALVLGGRPLHPPTAAARGGGGRRPAAPAG